MGEGKSSLWKFQVGADGLHGQLIKGGISIDSLVSTHLFPYILHSWSVKSTSTSIGYRAGICL